MGFDFLNDSGNQTPFACVPHFSVFFASLIPVICSSVMCISAQCSEMFSKSRIHRNKASITPRLAARRIYPKDPANLHQSALSEAFYDTIVDPDHTHPVALYLVVKYLYSGVCEKGTNHLFLRARLPDFLAATPKGSNSLSFTPLTD